MALQYFQLLSCRYCLRAPNSWRNHLQIVTQKSRTSGSIRCVGSIQVSQRIIRSEFSYEPAAWSHDSIESLKTDFSKNIQEEKVKILEEEVSALIEDARDGSSTLALLELIDDIERLGLGYRFRNNIRAALDQIVLMNGKIVGEEESSLHAISLRFRLLRQHGYDVSQDFLKRFKDSTGGLMKCLKEDVKGLLSLYEASFLAFKGERDLHSARLFAIEQLKNLKDPKNEVVMQKVNDALDLPLYRRSPRLEARSYIDSFAKRKDADKHLLEFAVLDFNMVQSIHKRDLPHASRWWKQLGLATKLSFTRDRVMECFFWSMGVAFEPQYSTCRIGLTKVCAVATTIDDIYDLYGSLEELEQFTKAVKRWDTDGLEIMPEYLQLVFLALYNTVNEMCYDTLIEQGQNIIPVVRKVWGELFETFLVEAKWSHSGHTPMLEEYLENGLHSITGFKMLTHVYFLISQEIKKDAVESLQKCHDLIKWASIIFRLCNDLATSSVEIKRGETANAIPCYMKEKSVSEEVAREHIKTLIDEAWWKLNETRASYSFEDPFIDTIINLARMSHCFYQFGDGLGAPDARDHRRIVTLLIEPITIGKEDRYGFLS